MVSGIFAPFPCSLLFCSSVLTSFRNPLTTEAHVWPTSVKHSASLQPLNMIREDEFEEDDWSDEDIEDDEEEEKSPYELLRERNIAENEKMFKKLFPEGGASAVLSMPKKAASASRKRSDPKRVSRRVTIGDLPPRHNPSRRCKGKKRVRYSGSVDEDGREDSDSNDEEAYDPFKDSDAEDDDDDGVRGGRMIVKLWGKSRNFIDSPERKRRRFVFLSLLILFSFLFFDQHCFQTQELCTSW